MHRIGTFASGILLTLSMSFSARAQVSPLNPPPPPPPQPIVLPFQIGLAASPSIGTLRNLPLASIVVCDQATVPNCQTVNNVLIDTASSGVRIRAGALSGLQLTPLLFEGNPIIECVPFEFGFIVGPVETAVVRFPPAFEDPATAAVVPIQVIDGPSGTTSFPPGCDPNDPKSGLELYGSLDINGVLGLGPFPDDRSQLLTPTYFTCPNNPCTAASVAFGQTVANPVLSLFLPRDRNGIIITMPSVSSAGAHTAGGQIIFGVGTLPGNDPNAIAPGHPFVSFDRDSCSFATTFQGSFSSACLVSGTGRLHFADPSLPRCFLPDAGLSAQTVFCPTPSPSSLVATISGTKAAPQSVTFEVADVRAAFSAGDVAFNDFADPFVFSGRGFLWGLPFFYNRAIFIAYGATPLGTAPAWGYAYLSPYDSVTISITTGNDDARSSSEITGALSIGGQTQGLCLKPAPNSPFDPVCKGSSAPNSWHNGNVSTQTFVTPLAQALAQGAGTLDISLLQSCDGLTGFDCDNWNLQNITVTLTDSTNPSSSKTVLNPPPPANGHCIARLKISPNATTVRFKLDGTNVGTYLDGTATEKGVATTCDNNGG